MASRNKETKKHYLFEGGIFPIPLRVLLNTGSLKRSAAIPLGRRMGAFLGTIALAFGLFGQSAATALSLDEAVRLTLRTNPDVQAAAADRRAADRAVDEARSGFFPEVDLRAASGIEKSKNVSTLNRADRGLGESGSVVKNRTEGAFSINQMVFDGFEVESDVEAQRALRDSAAHRVRQTSEDIALSAVDAYLQMLLSRALVALAADNVAVHQKFVELTTTRARAGVGRLADVQQAEARRAFAQSTLLAREGGLRDAEARFVRTVGVAPDNLVLPLSPYEALPPSIEEAETWAYARSPALAVAASEVEASRAAVERAEAPFYPRLDLQLGATRNRNIDGIDGPNEDATALMVLSYNLYRGGGDIARRREAMERLNSAIAGENQTRRAVVEELRFAWNALEVAEARLVALAQYAASVDQLRHSYRQQYDIGQRTLLDLLDTENELFNARSTLAVGEFDTLFSVYRTLAGTGSLLASLAVEAPREANPGR